MTTRQTLAVPGLCFGFNLGYWMLIMNLVCISKERELTNRSEHDYMCISS